MDVLDNLVYEYQTKSMQMGQILWNALLIFKTSFWLTFVLHCLACFWLFVGVVFKDKTKEFTWI